MGKMKPVAAADHTDENAGEWLSTRNKKKISPPPLKKRGSQLLRRPVPRSPLVTLMEDAPVALKTTNRQTSIADFFTPHLKELPPRDGKGQMRSQQAECIKQEQITACCSEGEMYADFDMPGPTPVNTLTQSSQDWGQPTAKPPVVNSSPGAGATGSITSVSSSAALQTAALTKDPSTFGKCGRVSSLNRRLLCCKINKGVKGCKSKVDTEEEMACSGGLGSKTDRFTIRGEKSLHGFQNIKIGLDDSPVCRHGDQLNQRSKVHGNAEYCAPVSGPIVEGKGGDYVHECLSQPECDISNASDKGLTYSDSLQTPGFLNETHHTLNFSQLPAVITWLSASNGGCRKNRYQPREDSDRTAKNNSMLGNLTEVTSLHFTDDDDDDDSSQDILRWSSSQHTCHVAGDERRAEQQVSVSGGEQWDSLQTPEFLNSPRDPGDSQPAGRGVEGAGRFCVEKVSQLSDDLHTPGFLKDDGQDASSVDRLQWL